MWRLSDIGANPSAEEAEEALEEGQTTVIDVVDAFRLNFLGDEASGTRLFGTKKDYMGQLKSLSPFLTLLGSLLIRQSLYEESR